MAEPAGLHQRVTRLETEMAEVRYLATKAEKDGADFQAVIKGQTGVINALRETQLEHGQMLAAHSRRFDALEERVDTGFAQVNARFEQVDARFEQVNSNFEQVNANFAAIDAKFAVLKAGQDRITELLTAHPPKSE